MTLLRPVLFLSFFAMLLAGCAGDEGDGCEACAAGGTVVTPVAKLTRTGIGQAIRLPEGSAQVSAWTYDIPPGVKLSVHKHPYPRFAYVMTGGLRVVLSDGRSFEYHPGEFIAEVTDVWHYGETLGAVPVRLLVIDTTPVGASNVVVRDPAAR